MTCTGPGAHPVPAPGLSVWDRGGDLAFLPGAGALMVQPPTTLSWAMRVCLAGTVRSGQGGGRASVEALSPARNLSRAPHAHTQLGPKPLPVSLA